MLLKSMRTMDADKGTVSGLIQWASALLNNHHIDTHRLDAEILLSHILGCERITLYTHPSKPLKDDSIALYESVIRRRAQRFPLQYITNRAEFMSLDFYVDGRVLIPRPETEVLVEAVIQRAQAMPEIREIVIIDIGAGSGNIAVSLAKQLENARIFA
ncbi:MAG: HemK/PrmC family methyltransferase, partial [Planctomycetota bacterium]